MNTEMLTYSRSKGVFAGLTLEGAVVVGGVSALGAALMQIGVPKDQAIKYESALKADKFVLVVLGNAEDEAKARSVLAGAKAPQTV